MARRSPVPEPVAEEKEPEFTHEEAAQILAHNVKSGLLHLPPDFRAEVSEDSSESAE